MLSEPMLGILDDITGLHELSEHSNGNKETQSGK